MLALSGQGQTTLPESAAIVAETVQGQRDWSQFIWGVLEQGQHDPVFRPVLSPSRLQSMAKAEAILCIPEGTSCIEAGQRVTIQLLKVC